MVQRLGELSVACSAVQDTRELLDAPHLYAGDMVFEVDDPARGSHHALGNPIKIAYNDVQYAPLPLLGEHTESALASLLGLDAAAIAALREGGAI